MRTTLLIIAIMMATAIGCGGGDDVTLPENPDPPVGADALQPAGDGPGVTVEGE